MAYTVGIDCTRPSDFGCIDYHRFSLGQVTAGGGLLSLTWTDNSGPPTNFQGILTVRLASQAESYWRNCLHRDLPSEYANVLVHGVGCSQAKEAIRAGGPLRHGEWRTPGWECAVVDRETSRKQIKCARGNSRRFRFDLD